MHIMEKEILGILKGSDISLTIEEVAAKAKINRITASKYLAVLEAKRAIAKREVGRAKLFYPMGARRR